MMQYVDSILVKALARYVVYPVTQSLRGRSTLKLQRQLGESERWSPLQLRRLQDEKLSRLVQHAYGHVPYYRNLMREHGLTAADITTVDDLPKLPLLSKATIRQHQGELLADNVSRKELVAGRTGGSTGEPLSFYHDGGALSAVRASKYRALSWWGIDLGDPEVMIWGSPIDIKRSDSIHGLGVRLLNRRMLPAFQMTEAVMHEYVRKLAAWRPKLVYGYASCLTVLARCILENKLDFGGWHPVLVLSTTEVLTQPARELIQQAFGAPVADEYGSREAGLLAFQCPHGSLHISAENLLLEVVRGGKPCAPGELGELVVTELNNYGMPFIRYTIGDVGVLSGKTCSCGRGLPVLESLGGRVNDMVVTPDGTLLTGSFFPHFFKEYRFVRQFQVRQPAVDQLDILLVTQQPPAHEELEQMTLALQRFVTERTVVRFHCVDQIPLTASGKLRHVISDVSARYL